MCSTTTSTAPPVGRATLDPVVRLRALETGEFYDLPPPAPREVILGSLPTSTIRLRDPTRQVSRRHARLVWHGETWSIRDLGSKNGVWIDGTRRDASEVHAGVELGIGGLTLLAESSRLIRIRSVVARYLGFAERERHAVDSGVRALRDFGAGRMSLVLCGEGDLLALAARLHRELLGPERPFVVGDDAAAFLSHLGAGTLGLHAQRLPRSLDDVVGHARAYGFGSRIILCTPTLESTASLLSKLSPVALLMLPTMASRSHELMRVFAEYVEDAAHELEQLGPSITEHDMQRVRSLSFTSLTDVEETARRLVAIRTLGVLKGASWLGLSHGALSRWAKRRGLSSSPIR